MKGIPDFICIGATKAGTSWLYDRLNELPNFRMPLHKEVGYFDRNTNWTFKSSPLKEKKLWVRVRNIKWLYMATYNVLRRTISGFRTFGFWFYWYFSNYNDKWYTGLFSQEYISGDITPSYALLGNGDIESIKKVCPDTKIIYLIRDPIKRAWSQYRMMNPKTQSDDEIIQYLQREDCVKRGDYKNNLNRYLGYFKPDNILVCFYDAISEKPKDLLEEILSFLKADFIEIDKYCRLESKSNVSRVEEIPKKVKEFLKEFYHDDIIFYSDYFGEFSKSWYQLYYQSKKPIKYENNSSVKASKFDKTSS